MQYRSKLAYEATVRAFLQNCAENNTGVYFWTFTTRKVHRLPEYGYIWSRFITSIRNEYRFDLPTLGGIRTIELQKRGAVHWHCLINRRLPVDRIREIGKPYGIGWMYVDKADSPRRASNYISKYIEKDGGAAFKNTGMPVWGTIGFAPWRTTVKQIIIRNEYTKFLSRVRSEIFGTESLPSWLARDIYQSWHIGYRVREDYIIWFAKERQSQGHDIRTWACWEPLRYKVWHIQQETEMIGHNDYDGLVPF